MGLYRDEGIVLRTHKLGEAARIEPPTHLQMLLYEGRGDLDIVTQCETLDHFRAIRDDLDRLTRAVSMLEAADQLSLEGEPNPALFQMLLGALRALAGASGPLVVPGFFLKVLALEGFRPEVEQCIE